VLPSRVSRSLDGEHALGVKLKKANRVRASTSQRAWIKGALNDAGSVPTSKRVSNYFASDGQIICAYWQPDLLYLSRRRHRRRLSGGQCSHAISWHGRPIICASMSQNQERWWISKN
jgi:hypothetical protein